MLTFVNQTRFLIGSLRGEPQMSVNRGKVLAFILGCIAFFPSAQSQSGQYSELTCTSEYDEARVDALSAWMDKPIKDSGPGGFAERAIKQAFHDNAVACIKDGYPAKEYVFSFKKADLENYGSYPVSRLSRLCTLGGTESWFNDDGESLDEMRVTKNFILIGSAPEILSINKKTLIGRKMETIGGASGGPYTYECVLSN